MVILRMKHAYESASMRIGSIKYLLRCRNHINATIDHSIQNCRTGCAHPLPHYLWHRTHNRIKPTQTHSLTALPFVVHSVERQIGTTPRFPIHYRGIRIESSDGIIDCHIRVHPHNYREMPCRLTKDTWHQIYFYCLYHRGCCAPRQRSRHVCGSFDQKLRYNIQISDVIN